MSGAPTATRAVSSSDLVNVPEHRAWRLIRFFDGDVQLAHHMLRKFRDPDQAEYRDLLGAGGYILHADRIQSVLVDFVELPPASLEDYLRRLALRRYGSLSYDQTFRTMRECTNPYLLAGLVLHYKVSVLRARTCLASIGWRGEAIEGARYLIGGLHV